MVNYYQIKRDPKDGWKVVKRSTGMPMFYGSHADCVEWIERNGDDESL